jgi:hypothetical protein
MANNNYLKEFKVHQVLLFIICGILIVLFLNYNNLMLYKKKLLLSSNTKLYDNVNNTMIESFNTISSIQPRTIPSVPEIFGSSNINSSITNIFNVIRLLSLIEKEVNDSKLATYNKLRITSFDIVNNLNNRLYEGIYNVNENKLFTMKNVFISKELDTRAYKNRSYSRNDRIPIPFKFEYGVKLDIDFILQFSYNINPLKVPSKITITEVPSSEFLIKSEKDKYNTYTLDSFSLDIEPNNPNIVIFKFNLPDFKHSTYTLNQELKLKLHFNTNVATELNYVALMSKLNVFTSTLQYNILRKNNILFSVDMRFIYDKYDITGSLKDYTEKEIENIFTDTLNDKYNKIITPLFVLDNDLSKHEKEINDIRKHYLLDELSSVKNNVKFFNTFK